MSQDVPQQPHQVAVASPKDKDGNELFLTLGKLLGEGTSGAVYELLDAVTNGGHLRDWSDLHNKDTHTQSPKLEWPTPLEPVLGSTDFHRVLFLSRQFFFADFVAGFFLLMLVRESVQKNDWRKIPGELLQNLYSKHP